MNTVLLTHEELAHSQKIYQFLIWIASLLLGCFVYNASKERWHLCGSGPTLVDGSSIIGFIIFEPFYVDHKREHSYKRLKIQSSNIDYVVYKKKLICFHNMGAPNKGS